MLRLCAFFVVAGSLFGQAQNLLVIPHYAIGDGWDSTIRIYNTSGSAQSVTAAFFGVHGEKQVVDVAGMGRLDTFVRAIPAGGVWELAPTTDTGLLIHGMVRITRASTDVQATVVFRQRVEGRPDFEAGVPASLPMPRVRIPFDNTRGYTTSVALQATAGGFTYPVFIYDENGQQIGNMVSIRLEANDRAIFATSERWPTSAGRKGTILIDGPNPGLGVMALLFNSSGPFSTIPLYPR